MWHPPKCSFHARGKCTLGNKCVFLHHEPTQAAAAENTQPNPKRKAKGKGKGKTAAVATPANSDFMPSNQQGFQQE